MNNIEPLVPLARLSDDRDRVITTGEMFNEYEALVLHAWLTRALYGEGYKLVPVKPTDDMKYAGRVLNSPMGREIAEATYNAMLAAAPEPARGAAGEST